MLHSTRTECNIICNKTIYRKCYSQFFSTRTSSTSVCRYCRHISSSSTQLSTIYSETSLQRNLDSR